VVRAAARAAPPDLISVQQHLPYAAAIAGVSAPVILQKHNFIRPPRSSGWLASASRRRHIRQFQRLQGIVFVSASVQSDFEENWPTVTIPRCIVPNGFDPSLWKPKESRSRQVLVVGRATPEKGLLEAAQGIENALKSQPDWSAVLVVSETARNLAYTAELEKTLGPLGARARILKDVPSEKVRALNEEAALVVVPSTWREPFGRTCLEAHAGGAAVISSGTGGLREISGPEALYLTSITPEAISRAVTALIEDEDTRAHIARAGNHRVFKRFGLHQTARTLDDFCQARIDDHRRSKR
jgi:glycosyltransferase involved in cell wall biosynthesis